MFPSRRLMFGKCNIPKRRRHALVPAEGIWLSHGELLISASEQNCGAGYQGTKSWGATNPSLGHNTGETNYRLRESVVATQRRQSLQDSASKEKGVFMVETMDGNMRTNMIKSRLQSSVIIAIVASMFGAACGLIYADRNLQGRESRGNAPTSEIIVPNDKGLLFKSEDGTPLLRIGKDEWGTHVRLLSSDGKPLVELNSIQGTGGIAVGSKDGMNAYINAHSDSSTITLIGKYGKEAVELTSATTDGSGSLSINEGSKGYHAVEIGGGPNRAKSKGTITINGANGAGWRAP